MKKIQEASLPRFNITQDFRSDVTSISDAVEKAKMEERNFEEIGRTIISKFGSRNVEFQYRHKRPERIHAKMMSKGYEASQIHDVLAGIFKCRNKNFANEVAKYLFNVYRDQIINFERKMEGMGKGNDRTGYQDYSEAFHINLNLNGLGVEIQVMTKKAAQLKDIAHDQYKRVRVGGELDPEMARLTALGFRQPEPQKTGRKPVPRFDPKGKLAGGRQRDYSFRDYVQKRDND